MLSHFRVACGSVVFDPFPAPPPTPTPSWSTVVILSWPLLTITSVFRSGHTAPQGTAEMLRDEEGGMRGGGELSQMDSSPLCWRHINVIPKSQSQSQGRERAHVCGWFLEKIPTITCLRQKNKTCRLICCMTFFSMLHMGGFWPHSIHLCFAKGTLCPEEQLCNRPVQ